MSSSNNINIMKMNLMMIVLLTTCLNLDDNDDLDDQMVDDGDGIEVFLIENFDRDFFDRDFLRFQDLRGLI